ncbi:MAG: HAD family hydrolase [Lachnospiraceae bacterium]|nr:HAD family hydrolase [Lachnospiraceae bacterium]
MIRTVIFDIDDTLYNYKAGNEAGIAAVCGYLKEHFGLNEAYSAAAISEAQRQQEARIGFASAAIHDRLIRYQILLENENLPVIPHARVMDELYWETLLAVMEAEAGVIPLIRALKEAGIRIGIGTNMTGRIQYVKLEKLGLADCIDFLVTSEEAGSEKPEARFYRLLKAKADAEPEECVFIGDSKTKDAEAARREGMIGLWYSAGKETKEPDSLIIRDFRDCLASDGIRLGDQLIPYKA